MPHRGIKTRTERCCSAATGNLYNPPPGSNHLMPSYLQPTVLLVRLRRRNAPVRFQGRALNAYSDTHALNSRGGLSQRPHLGARGRLYRGAMWRAGSRLRPRARQDPATPSSKGSLLRAEHGEQFEHRQIPSLGKTGFGCRNRPILTPRAVDWSIYDLGAIEPPRNQLTFAQLLLPRLPIAKKNRGTPRGISLR